MEPSTENDDMVVLVIDSKRITATKSDLGRASEYFHTMFNHQFREKTQKEVVLLGMDGSAVEELVAFCLGGTLSPTEDKIYDLLQAAQMLQLDQARKICCMFLRSLLLASPNSALEMYHKCNFLGEEGTATLALKHVLWKFGPALKVNYVTSISNKQLVNILDKSLANVENELVIFNVIKRWCSDNEFTEDELLSLLDCLRFSALSETELELIITDKLVSDRDRVRELVTQRRTTAVKPKRQSPFYPCVVGRMRNGNDRDEYLDYIFCFDREKREVFQHLPLLPLNTVSVKASGYQVCTDGPDIFVTGGEYALGRNNWNRQVWKHDGLAGDWHELVTLEPRRHHGICVKDGTLVLVGGFGRHRVILNSVLLINTKTAAVEEMTNLPVNLYSPATCVFRGELYVFKGEAFRFSESLGIWQVVESIQLPRELDFTSATATADCIYLTARHSAVLYKVEHKQGLLAAEQVGKFQNEAQNICLLDNIIYCFGSDQFSTTSYVETYDTRRHEFDVVWSQVTPDFDFSPYYSFGCFALVKY